MNHENIVNGVACYYDVDKKLQIIIMEYCVFGDLARLIHWHRLADLRFTEDEVLRLIVQMVTGLDYAHKKE